MAKEIKNNHLYIDGCDTVELAKTFGTPLYVYSVSEIREECQKIQAQFLTRYSKTRAAYAAKAFCTTAMLQVIKSEGLSLDVVSGGSYIQRSKLIFQQNTSSLTAITNPLKN